MACASLFLGALAFGVEGKESAVADPPLPAPAAAGSPTASLGRHLPGGTVAPPTRGNPIASLDRVPVGGAIDFQAPSGEPSVLVRLGQNRVAAFSRVCTHAGCLVDYDQQAGLLVCPCHGAEFDPAHGGVPVAGPAPTALPEIPVAIDKASGTVVAER